MPTAERDANTSASPVTVFMPAYNEAASITQVLREFAETVVKPLNGRLLVCEDGSTDGTEKVLQQLSAELPMQLVTGRARKGYAGAMKDGLRQVNSDLVFFVDSDGQYDPVDFWKVWEARESYDMVIGRKVRREEKFYRTLLSRSFHVLVKALTTVPLEDMDCGFRLIRRATVEQVLPEVGSLPHSFWAEFSIVAYRKGFRILEVPISHRPSQRGVTSIYTWNKMPRIIMGQVTGLLRLSRRLNREDRTARTRTVSVTSQT
jgi:glycosyltransferase involved in cell wall biosynthesis